MGSSCSVSSRRLHPGAKDQRAALTAAVLVLFWRLAWRSRARRPAAGKSAKGNSVLWSILLMGGAPLNNIKMTVSCCDSHITNHAAFCSSRIGTYDCFHRVLAPCCMHLPGAPEVWSRGRAEGRNDTPVSGASSRLRNVTPSFLSPALPRPTCRLPAVGFSGSILTK